MTFLEKHVEKQQNKVIDKALEELLELSQVLITYKNKSTLDKEHLLDEMADCTIMIEQLRILFYIDVKDISVKLAYKLDKLKRGDFIG